MNDLPRQKLRELIIEYGRSLCDDPRRCEALLKDYCGQYKREIFALSIAQKNRVAYELINVSSTIPIFLLKARLVRRLQDDLGLTEAVAEWAVISWGIALDIAGIDSKSQSFPLEQPTPVHHIEPVAVSRSPVTLKSATLTYPAPLSVFRDKLRDGGEGPSMVVIPTGDFWMGSPDTEVGRDSDENRCRVKILSFTISQYPITFDEYDRFCVATGRDKPSDSGWGRQNRPVINVTWHDAMAYTEWLSIGRLYRQRYRLPSEAEWEYAARAGTQTAYWWGEEIGSRQVNCLGCGSPWGGTSPVGSYPANPWGLYDIVGNVREWTGSLYQEKYDGTETRCVEKNAIGLRTVRGGSWDYQPAWVRSAYRNRLTPTGYYLNLGFRVARSL